MNFYDKTLDAYKTISGKTEDHLLQYIHDLCDISTEYSLEGRSVLGKVVRVIDGDSIKVSIPVDGHIWTFPVIIADIDCPEIRTRNDKEKALGLKAKARVEELVMGKIVSLHLREFDNFGRLLGSIVTSYGVDVGKDLISRDMAVKFEGKKHPWFS